MEPMTASDVQPSVDSVPILLEPGERSPFDESVAAGLVGLVYLAKQAFTEKRRKQCLEITGAILKIDPEHADARTIQDCVRAELVREFANAQAMVKEAQANSDPVLYGQAAAALRKLVDADPDNLEAQMLLHKAVAAGHSCTSTPANRPERKLIRRSVLLGAVAVVLVAALTLLSENHARVAASLSAVTAGASSTAGLPSDAPANPETGVQLVLNDNPGSSVRLLSNLRMENADQTRAVAAQPARISTPAPVAAGVAALGNLAVSAAVPVEIYRGEEHLGSTPTTLQLPPGPQTLEYRYQGMRQTLTHLITSQETTTAMVSFPVKVQINAKPWARVFVEGVQLTPIGQTPLGDVSVAIGSVLVFQSPGFPDKRYRVTARDAAIQMTFP
jgi:hypothetical protein